jgi:hypothetical protein
MELVVSCVKFTSAKNIFLHFAYIAFIYWHMTFKLGRKISCIVFFLWIELEVIGSKSWMPKIDFYTSAYTAFIFRLKFFIFVRHIPWMVQCWESQSQRSLVMTVHLCPELIKWVEYEHGAFVFNKYVLVNLVMDICLHPWSSCEVTEF